jgi:D-alanine-D-alanine ligase-like ATP-grasp enzyme
LHAAEKLGLSFDVISKHGSYARICHKDRNLFVVNSALSVNDQVASRLARDKFTSLQVLQKNDIKIPEQKLISTAKITFENFIELAVEYAQEKYPLVVKPVKQSLGRGVYTDIRTDEELRQVVKKLYSAKYRNLLLEQFVTGKDYRVLVFQQEVLDVVERIPAHVIGDGKTALKQLIKQKNASRAEQDMPPIRTDDKLHFQIKKENLTLDSVIEKDKRVRLRGTCHMITGGELERIPLSNIHDEFKEVLTNITRISRLDFCGIDIITEDITAEKPDYVVNEINSGPFIDLHYFLKEGPNTEVVTMLLQKYFNLD